MRKLAPLFLAGALLLSPLLAAADQVVNNLDTTIDANLEVLSLHAGGQTGTVTFSLVQQNGDGKNGCNITGNNAKLVVNLTSSAPGVATVSPSTITFNNCVNTQSVTVTSGTVGSSTITLSQNPNTVGTLGSFIFNTGDFRVDVSAPLDTTPPVIVPTVAGTLGTNGWYTSDVTISWSVTDPESAITSQTGCTTSVLNTDTTGQTFTCSATSQGGTSSNSVTVKRDATNPLITASASTSDGPYTGAWTNKDVTVSFVCNASVSGQASLTSPTLVSTEGTNQSTTGTCLDNAGNTASATFTGINIDKTAPHYGTPSRASGSEANTNGWNNTDVTVNFPCIDDLSGAIASPIAETVTAEGANQTATAPAAACVDQAGNVAASDSSLGNISIDKTAPVVTMASVTGTLGNNGWYTTDVTVHFQADDSLSGFPPAESPVLSFQFPVTSSGEGAAITVSSGTVTDLAGNTASLSQNFKIDKTAPVITFIGASPAANGNGWNNSSVTLSWSCTDSGSGVISPAVTRTIGTEGMNQSATGTCEDNAGLQASDTQGSINIDETAPEVTSPNDGAAYVKGQAVTASYACDDNLGAVHSGIDSCVGSVALGSNLNTAAAGVYHYTVTATDKAGNSRLKTVTYHVFDFVGLFAPITDNLKSFQKPSTIPVKFQLSDGQGGFFGGATATLEFSTAGQNVWHPATSSGSSNSGDLFRYDSSAQQYIYNLKTANPFFVSGQKYDFRITISGMINAVIIKNAVVLIK